MGLCSYRPVAGHTIGNFWEKIEKNNYILFFERKDSKKIAVGPCQAENVILSAKMIKDNST